MKNVLLGLSLVCCLLVFYSCGSSAKTEKAETTTTVPASASANTAVAHPLPSISLEEMQLLYEQCDYIDFIFYNMDFSMSINTKNNVQTVVTFVDKTQPDPTATCKAMGRIIYQKSGTIIMEADMHYDEDCQHFIFYKDGKKAYANNMTEQGKAYFEQMFSKVRVVPSGKH